MQAPTSTPFLLVASGILAACVVAVGALFVVVEPGDDPVFTRDVTSYEVISNEAVVRYEYRGEKLPPQLAPDEDVSKRTDSSYTRVVGTAGKGKERIYEGIFFAQPAFIQHGGEWYYLERATTTEAAFYKARAQNPVASLFWKEAYAADLYAETGDGYAGASESFFGALGDCTVGSIWNTVHDDAGSVANYTFTSAYVYGYAERVRDVFNETDECFSEILRGFLPIITSSIPTGATITAATLNVYVNTKYTGDNDGIDFMTIVQTDHAGHITVVATDYNNCGAIDNPTEGIDIGERKDITSISTVAYTSFSLNATGLSWIKKNGQASTCSATAGVSCFGIREGHDVTDAVVLNGAYSGVAYYASEQTGTSQDPYLAVTYTASASAFWQFQDF